MGQMRVRVQCKETRWMGSDAAEVGSVKSGKLQKMGGL